MSRLASFGAIAKVTCTAELAPGYDQMCHAAAEGINNLAHQQVSQDLCPTLILTPERTKLLIV